MAPTIPIFYFLYLQVNNYKVYLLLSDTVSLEQSVQILINNMYNGQRNSVEQIGQIKQNKTIATDYTRPRKGSYCQYKQQKFTKDVNTIIPAPPAKEEFIPTSTTTRRSSLGFYDSRQVKKNEVDPRLQKYTSKQMHQNQRSLLLKNDRSYNFIAKNREKEYEQYLNYDTDRFLDNRQKISHKNYGFKQQRPFFPENDYDQMVMPNRLIKQDPKRFHKYANDDESQFRYDRNNQRGFNMKKSQIMKNYQDDSFSFKYQENYDPKRNQNPLIHENYGKSDISYPRNQVPDRHYLPKRQKYNQSDRFEEIQNQKQAYQPKKLDQYRKNINHLYHQRQYSQITQSHDSYVTQAQTPSFNPSSKNYTRQKSSITQTENFYDIKRDNQRRQQQFLGISPRYQKTYQQPNNVRLNNGTPKKQKNIPQEKYDQRNLTNSRKDHLISKSKILRQKMNELSADKKLLISATKNPNLNTQYDQSKNQSHQQRLQRLKNSKDRVYESPFKQTTRSTTNLKMRYGPTNTETQKNEYPKNQQKLSIKTQENTKMYSFDNRQNNKEQVQADRKGEGNYGPVENDCMNRISILNSKINEKISSIINSYGRPSH